MKPRPFATALVLVLCLWSAHAQSGRRHAKPAPAAPIPTPTPEPTPIPKKLEKDSQLLFYIGADRNDSFTNIPFTYHDAALRGCVNRLRAGTSGSIDVTDKSFSRGEAIKKAKSETSSYVVLLTLKLDSMARSYDDLILEFVVFAPQTAKVMTTGHSYTSGTRTGPVVVGPSRNPTSGLYREKLIELAGEDAGNRIIKALHLDVNLPKGP